MFPWLRLLHALLTLIGQAKADLLATTCVRLRVWPNDLDFNFHVNNGRYLALADIGRIHWFARVGVFTLARQQKAMPVVGDAIAKFRRELNLWQRFEIRSRLVGWDHKWGFLEHRFVRNNRVIAIVAIRGVFKGPNGPVDPNIFLAALSHSLPSPPLPQWTTLFQEGSEALSLALRDEESRATL
jgi:acyl-CoA thioesterase FadM